MSMSIVLLSSAEQVGVAILPTMYDMEKSPSFQGHIFLSFVARSISLSVHLVVTKNSYPPSVVGMYL